MITGLAYYYSMHVSELKLSFVWKWGISVQVHRVWFVRLYTLFDYGVPVLVWSISFGANILDIAVHVAMECFIGY